MSNVFKSDILNMEKGNNLTLYNQLIADLNNHIDKIKQCGGKASIQRQHDKGRLTVRERIEYLIDDNSSFFEIGSYLNT